MAEKKFSGFKAMNPRACTMLIPLYVEIDFSGSMRTPISALLTRHQAAVDALIKSLRRLREDDLLADNVHLFLSVFNNNTVTWLYECVPLSQIDLDELKAELLSIRCTGNTPIGQALTEALNSMPAVKQQAASMGITYKQPLLCIVSDGIPTDDITEAVAMISSRQKEQKLVMLPIAIGTAEARFPLFEQLAASQGGDLPILTCESDIRKYFRLLDRTIVLIRDSDFKMTSLESFGRRMKI